MNDNIVLGIDCGTQSLRAALYRVNGDLLAQSSSLYETRYPRSDWAEQDPEDWWRALNEAIGACLARSGVPGTEIAAMGIDSTSYTGVWCEEDGAPLRPALLWMDHRAAQEAESIAATRHPALEHSGWRLSPEWMLPKAVWMHRHEPDTHKAAARIVDASDWLVRRLTGEWATATGSAASKRHWTPQEGWPVGLYELVGVPDLVEKGPDKVLYSGDDAGRLTPAAARALGLSSKCIVAHAGMDGWVSPIGTGCFDPGVASLTLGTSTVLILETAEPKVIDGIMGPFPDGIRRNRFVYEAGQTSGAAVVGWTMDLIGVAPDSEAHAQIECAAASIPPGSRGLVAFDAWRGNRTPWFDAAARGTIMGLTLDHTPAHVYRAVLEGCAFGIRNVLSRIEAAGHAVSELRVCGSGAANRLWAGIIAEAIGKPLRISREKHATCLGSAVCAAAATGAFSGIEAASEAMAPAFETVAPEKGMECYDESFAAYVELYERNKPLMARLAAMAGDESSEAPGRTHG
jgi:ribulose kinase